MDEVRAKIAVFGSGSELAAALCDELASRKIEVVRVSSRSLYADETLDYGEPREYSELTKSFFAKHPNITGVVIFCGKRFFRNTEDLDDLGWIASLQANLIIPSIIAANAIKLFKERGGGSLLFMSSIWAVKTGLYRAPYGIGKVGIEKLVKQIAREQGKFNIKANAICPGVIDTISTREAVGDQMDELKSKIPLGCFGKPSDIAVISADLLLERHPFLTGQSIVVDGGFVLD